MTKVKHPTPAVPTPFGFSLHAFCARQDLENDAINELHNAHPHIPLNKARQIVKHTLDEELSEWLRQL